MAMPLSERLEGGKRDHLFRLLGNAVVDERATTSQSPPFSDVPSALHCCNSLSVICALGSLAAWIFAPMPL